MTFEQTMTITAAHIMVVHEDNDDDTYWSRCLWL